MNFQFSIVGLPRSRTYWFSKLLTFGGYHCFHDFHAYKYRVPLRKALGNASFTPWQRHTGKVVIIERDRIEAEVSFLNYVDEPDEELTGNIFNAAEKAMEGLEGLRVKYEDVDKRLDEILAYIGVSIPQSRIDEFKLTTLNSPDTSESNSKVAYG